MRKSEYINMAERETTYWWHVGRLKIIEAYLTKFCASKKRQKILNVGSGTGGTIGTLEKFGQVDNVEVSDAAIKFAKQKGFKRMTKVKGIKLPYKDKTYNLVVAFDVLEHIEEHIVALNEWRRVVKDEGLIIITVPAYQWLWSGHDVSLHHKRRYNKKMLQNVAKAVNLKITRMSYAIVFSLPLVVGFRLINKLLARKTDSETSYVNVPDFLNRLFILFLALEARLHKYIKFPAGTSIVAVLSKNDG